MTDQTYDQLLDDLGTYNERTKIATAEYEANLETIISAVTTTTANAESAETAKDAAVVAQVASESALSSSETARDEAQEAADNIEDLINPHQDISTRTYDTNDMFMESYGQSLSLGFNGDPAVSTTQLYNDVMFASGIRKLGAEDLTSYVPMVEQDGDGYGETPVSGITSVLSPLLNASNRFVGSASGQSGKSIEDLNKGSANYTDFIARLTAAKVLADEAGRSFSLRNIFWTQGEQDYVGFKNGIRYTEMLLKLLSDIQTDSMAISGQLFIPEMIMYQLATHRRYGRDYPEIALAQLEAEKQGERLFIACPMYQFNYANDNTHLLDGDEYYKLGKYYGFAAKELRDTNQVSNCHIKQVKLKGDEVLITINTPYAPLVIDVDIVAEANNYGFDIYSDIEGGVVDIIESVEIAGLDKVKLTLNGAIPTDARVVYAWGRETDTNTTGNLTGPRGNIRDSRNETWTTPSGAEQRADNWLLISDFKIDQSYTPIKVTDDGKSCVIIDAQGNENQMVWISKFRCQDINAAILDVHGVNLSLGNGVHPAFLKDGVEIRGFWCSKYLASESLKGGSASISGVQPKSSISLTDSRVECEAKGDNWHLMSIFESYAIALLAAANGLDIHGNTASGFYLKSLFETARRGDTLSLGNTSGVRTTDLGTGPRTWSSDHQSTGVYDLVGNLDEWVDLVSIDEGQIILALDNNPFQDESEWVSTGAFYNGTTGIPELNETLETQGASSETMYSDVTSEISKSAGYVPRDYLRRVGLEFSEGTEILSGGCYVKNTGQRVMSRGGNYNSSAYGGINGFLMISTKTNAPETHGYRACYFEGF